MDVRVGLWRKLSTEELMLLNCGAGEDSWESLALQRAQTSHPKVNQCWTFIGKTDAETGAPIYWPPDVKSWLTGKDDDGKDWRQEKKGMTAHEMVGWHHRLNGHESESTPGVGDGQGGLMCCSPWGRKESDTTERLSWTETFYKHLFYYSCYFPTLSFCIRAALGRSRRRKAVRSSQTNLRWEESLYSFPSTTVCAQGK